MRSMLLIDPAAAVTVDSRFEIGFFKIFVRHIRPDNKHQFISTIHLHLQIPLPLIFTDHHG